MPENSPLRSRGRSARVIAAGIAAALAVTGTALSVGPALADPAPATSATPSLASLDSWSSPVDPTQYDWAATTVGTTPALRMSNWVADPTSEYGNITELSSPAIADAGEPGTSGAGYNTFSASYTVSASTFDAQPGLAVEVSADKGGNRAGGSLLLRHDADNELTLSNFFVKPDAESDDLSDWANATATVPFSAPVTITFVDHFEANATDVVSIYANGVFVMHGGTFEGYERAEGDTPGSVDSLLFRAGHTKAVDGGAWEDATPTSDQLDALKGGGFSFSNISYAVSNSIILPTPTITGTAAVGSTLTANAPTDVADTTKTYQWLSNGAPISGATQSTYVIPATALTHRLSVRVVVSKAGFAGATGTTAQTSAVTDGLLLGAISVTGTLAVGGTLSSHVTTNAPATLTYQWYRGSSAITGATYSTYALGAADLGAGIRVKVHATRTAFVPANLTSDATTLVRLGTLTVGAPKLTGNAQSGHLLLATAGKTTSGASVLYWFVSDNGAQSTTVQVSTSKYFLVPSYLKGARIFVYTTATKAGYTFATSESSNESAVIK
jgi:hypothetical protein